jgi:ferrous iron transport protein B
MKTLDQFDAFADSLNTAVRSGQTALPEKLKSHPLYGAAQTLVPNLIRKDVRLNDFPPRSAPVLYEAYREKRARTDADQRQETLTGTVAGRIGKTLEGITRYIGFDYRTNIALIGGFAAKEVIVSTLGTAYSLGDVDPEQSGSLSQRLRHDPAWNPLRAFTLILFTMLYVPCFVTVISIRKESSTAWALFSIGFNLVTAFLFSMLIYQVGSALGIGT